MIIFDHGCSYGFDGSGNRLIFYLKGCNFCCDWCGAPESISPQIQTMYYPNRTTVSGKKVSSQWVIDKALRSSGMIDGVTFGGGEPTLQSDELLEILPILQQHQIQTALESNASTTAYREVIKYIDQLFSDLKTLDADKFAARINPDRRLLEQVKSNLYYAASHHNDLTIRIPVVSDLNDQAGPQQEIADFLAQIKAQGGNFKVELLQQHHIAEPKYAALQREYKCRDVKVPDEECMENFKNILKNCAIEVL